MDEPTPKETASSETKVGSLSSGKNGNDKTDEADELRKQLRAALQSINRREPLEPTYKRLLLGGLVTRRSPVIPKDRFYRRLPSRLRERVEAYTTEMQGKDPFDRISQRQPLEESAMRAAFTLREAKEHEQTALLEATLAAKEMHPVQKRHLDGIVLQLQDRKDKKMRIGAIDRNEQARRAAELEAKQNQARLREEARLRREAERRRQREQLEKERSSRIDSPQQALHKMIEPIFKKLWDMTFVVLGNINPFRVVIDRDTCASLNAPDYCDVIKTPMNLIYIRDKIKELKYQNLQQFFDDVELMIDNALLYNSDPHNPYRIAAEDMKRRNAKLMKKVHERLQAQTKAAK